jgi:hypothetical protein
VRSNGWLEIEIGEFFNSGLEDEVQVNVKETDYWKKGLFLEGMEVRPITCLMIVNLLCLLVMVQYSGIIVFILLGRLEFKLLEI